MLANTQNAAAVAAAMTRLATLSAPKKCSKWLCAQPDVMAAPIARTSAMIDFHGLAFALTMATWEDRSRCGPPCTCIRQVLPSHRNRAADWPNGTGANGRTGTAVRRCRDQAAVTSGLPTGSRMLPARPLETPAAEVYQATSAVMTPM
jgi:hypothetical protein